jgi:hypothetical protein
MVLPIITVVFLWMYLGPDESIYFSLKDLFLNCPLFPMPRYPCSFWLFAGIVSLSTGCVQAIKQFEKNQSFKLITVSIIELGAGLILASFIIYFLKRKALKQ